MSEPTNLDELDRLRAAASYADKWEYISDFVSVACWMYCHGGSPTMEPADKAWLFTLIEAYPALAAELRELRAKVAELTAANIGLEQLLDETDPIMQTRGPK